MLPGTIRSAPLCPIRLSADTVGTSMSSGCRRPARVTGCSRRSPQRGHGRPGDAVDDLEALLHPVARGLLHPRAGGVDDRQRLLVADVAGAPPGSIPASKQPSIFHRLPMPAMIRWSIRASPIGRVGSSSRSRRRNSCLVELGREDVRAEAGDPPVQRVRESVISSSTGPLIWATSFSPWRISSHVLRGGAKVGGRARATCRSCAGASGSPARSRSAGTGACRARRRS